MRSSPVRAFLLTVLVFLANGRPHPEVDCVAAPYTAWSLVRHGSYDLRGYPSLRRYVGGPIRVRPDGSWLSIRPPGSALAAVPFVAPMAAFRERPFGDLTMNQLGKLVAALSVAGAAAFFFIVCRRLAPPAAWPATLVFALGTCLYSVASQALWMHGPAVFWLCCALYFLTGPHNEARTGSLAAGCALGLAVLTRPTTAFFALATCGTLVIERRWRQAVWLALGGVIPALVLWRYNSVNFGHSLLGGYRDDNWADSTPLWMGLAGLLLAPSRGVFIYSPALVVAFGGAWTVVRRAGTWQPVRTLLVA
jgi:hypothetical protein